MKAITYKTFTLIPTITGRFDLINNQEAFDQRKKTLSMQDKCYGLDMTLETCIGKMVNISIELDGSLDVITLKQYLTEYKKHKAELLEYIHNM